MSVVPVIGFLLDKKAFKPLPNPAEVEEIFDVPLEMFLKVLEPKKSPVFGLNLSPNLNL